VLVASSTLAAPATNPDFLAGIKAFEAKDYAAARTAFADASAAGDAAGSNNLAVMIEAEGGSLASTSRSREVAALFRKAAGAGLPEAEFNLGQLMHKGQPGAEGASAARDLWAAAAESGLLAATVNLAVDALLDPHADYAKKNSSRATILRAARIGSAVAQFDCGVLAETGGSDDPEHTEAQRCYRQAAELGFQPANARLVHIRHAGMPSVPREEWQRYLATAKFTTGSWSRVVKEHHVVQSGEVISLILYRVGVVASESQADIYGPNGYLTQMRGLNPDINDWNYLEPGTTLTLLVPDPSLPPPKLLFDETLQFVRADSAEPPPPAQVAPPQGYPAYPNAPGYQGNQGYPSYQGNQGYPSNQGYQGYPGYPGNQGYGPQGPGNWGPGAWGPGNQGPGPGGPENPSSPNQISPQRSVWDYSVFEAFGSGMESVYNSAAKTRMAGYLGLRFGYSLTGNSDPLTKNMQMFGLIAELRDGRFKGARAYYDDVPKVEATVNGQDSFCDWSRLLVGWAFEIPSPWFTGSFHVTPKVGNYTVDATVPMTADATADDTPLVIHVEREYSVGLEADAEITHFWYDLRVSLARDIPALGNLVAKNQGGGIATSREGLDLFLKGGRLPMLGDKISLAYLVFVANEQITITTNDGSGAALDLAIPFGGVGLTMSW